MLTTNTRLPPSHREVSFHSLNTITDTTNTVKSTNAGTRRWQSLRGKPQAMSTLICFCLFCFVFLYFNMNW